MDIKRACVTGLVCFWGAWSCASDEQVELTVSASPKQVDLLFVIDNSNTMLDQQTSLRAQVPRLVEILTSGVRAPGDPKPFAPIRDLHVGVVSSDMGWPGVEPSASCAANGGDDGKLRHSGARALDASCAAEYPLYLGYHAGHSDPAQLVHDVRCITEIGTGGCSVEQPLEAALKALSPKAAQGRGDLEPESGGNRGFLRDDSLLIVVLLTDEDDCSIADVSQLGLDDKAVQDLDLGEDIHAGCLRGAGLHDVRERYLKGLRALRPGHEERVVFLAIAGIPPDLVDTNVLAKTDFAAAPARDQFFDAILKDSRMQPGIDRIPPRELELGLLRPSCAAPPDSGETQPHLAFPARRIVELAKAFGENGMVQSLCSDSFAPVIDTVLRAMAPKP